jgi:hypothetical protein
MDRLSDVQKEFLREATSRYHAALPNSPADEYLTMRGLGWESIKPAVNRFRIGYVGDPLPGHEQYKGYMSIPYLRWSADKEWAVVSIRFRRVDDGKPKYLTLPGDRPRLFNTMALIKDTPNIAITEGELDAITATVCGIPAVGVPGVQAWQPWFREPFLGYRNVYVLADGDDPGMAFATKIASSLPNGKIIPMPQGEDVNSLVVLKGKEALLERLT